MESGIVTLRPLYDIILANISKGGIDRKSPERKKYNNSASKECELVPDQQGFYLWGCYEPNGLWKNCYLGKAGFGKTGNLQKRILKELDSEGASLWLSLVDQDFIEIATRRNYPKMAEKYIKQLNRLVNRVGCTHIIWVADPNLENASVLNVESDLIETLNPTANIQRPVPPERIQSHTVKVIEQFRKQIHENRTRRYEIPGKRKKPS